MIGRRHEPTRGQPHTAPPITTPRLDRLRERSPTQMRPTEPNSRSRQEAPPLFRVQHPHGRELSPPRADSAPDSPCHCGSTGAANPTTAGTVTISSWGLAGRGACARPRAPASPTLRASLRLVADATGLPDGPSPAARAPGDSLNGRSRCPACPAPDDRSPPDDRHRSPASHRPHRRARNLGLGHRAAADRRPTHRRHRPAPRRAHQRAGPRVRHRRRSALQGRAGRHRGRLPQARPAARLPANVQPRLVSLPKYADITADQTLAHQPTQRPDRHNQRRGIVLAAGTPARRGADGRNAAVREGWMRVNALTSRSRVPRSFGCERTVRGRRLCAARRSSS
jgi:hypothetical protein